MIKRHWKTHIKNKDTGMEVCKILNVRLDYVNKKGWESWMMVREFDDLLTELGDVKRRLPENGCYTLINDGGVSY